ncbi:MAG: nucleotide-binding protein [Verrucomicrobia bacterium]|nr:nucleotide-binding protein [Verrucomicrobiota bacterium]
MRKKSVQSAQLASAPTREEKRAYLSQSDVPNTALSQALRVAQAIVENYGSKPSTPLEVGEALDMTPTSGGFRNLCGASIAFGLTEGGYNAISISITPLAERILKPETEGDDLVAKREAFLLPRIIREFLERYDGSQLPVVNIAKNVLEKMGVPPQRTDDIHDLILTGATELALIREIKGKRFVQLKGVGGSNPPHSDQSQIEETGDEPIQQSPPSTMLTGVSPLPPLPNRTGNNRVFVTHGKNRALVAPIKRLLEFGQMQAVVSVEQQSVSKPVPDKVMDDMRSCSAAIIHVDDEVRLMDTSATEHVILNPNVLIEIGAAMGLYGRSFILLVKEGTRLPSNLQGLFEVRYSGDTLDGDATIRLMEAINELKKSAEAKKG